MHELYVIARRVLLDALDALESHRDSVILVGAQAVYLRVGEGDLAVAPHTTDGDLAIDPRVLNEAPPLEEALMSAGFTPKNPQSVGMWITHRSTSTNPRTEVGVDLLVPEAISPGGGRAARLQGHGRRTARNVQGLDGAVVDVDVMGLRSFEAGDDREARIRVAGPAALLVAKVHKIQDREGTPRQNDKDALDALRLLRGTAIEEMVERFNRILDDEQSRHDAEAALHLLEQQFGHRSGLGVQMVLRAVAALEDPEEMSRSCEFLSSDLLRVLGR